MAKKKEEINTDLKDLKEKIKEGKAIIGTERVFKLLKSNELKQVFLASNCPDEVRENIEYYAQLTNTLIVKLDANNEELGVICKRGHFISVLGIIGE